MDLCENCLKTHIVGLTLLSDVLLVRRLVVSDDVRVTQQRCGSCMNNVYVLFRVTDRSKAILDAAAED